MTMFSFLGSWIVIGGVEVLRLLIIKSIIPFIYVVLNRLYCGCDE